MWQRLFYYPLEIVQLVIQDLIQPSFRAANIPILSVVHAGSQHEYTALPGSDYDLQFPINMTQANTKPNLHGVQGVTGWKIIEGGPGHLLTENGYLSNETVNSFYEGVKTELIKP